MILNFNLQCCSAFNPLYGTRENLLLPRYYKWFQVMVKNWITLAVEKCKNLTVQAISVDSAIAVTDLVKFSTSAVDVTGFLLQLGQFWKNLNWPEAITAYGFASTMMEEINKCAQFYVEEVAKRLTHEDVFDEQGRFRATEKVSNTHYLSLVPRPLHYQCFFECYTEKLGVVWGRGYTYTFASYMRC